MVERKVFDAIALFCETQQVCTDTAKELAKRISEALLPPFRRKVYDVLTNKPKTVHQIAQEADMGAASTAAVLNYLIKQTSLVTFIQCGNGKKWFKS